jgi:hypothetical protein
MIGVWIPNKQMTGEAIMTAQSSLKILLNAVRSEKMADIRLVSAFGLWAVLLGLSPVLAYHALMS